MSVDTHIETKSRTHTPLGVTAEWARITAATTPLGLPVSAIAAEEIQTRPAAAARRLVAADPYAHKYIIAIAVTLAAVLELIDTSIVNVAIPHTRWAITNDARSRSRGCPPDTSSPT